LLLALGPHDLHAQVGNYNPSGASGIFNGQAGGCGYDPYTANATRSITDISVAGAVGEYPLALVRTANSRAPSTTEVFGWSGGWSHNYNWILEDSPSSTTANFHPNRYTVEFPDGRVESFRAVTWDSDYRVRPGPNTPAQSTSAGVRERFVPLNLNSMFAYLILPDGGKVEFKAVQLTNGTYYWYKYHATAIIDPYGLRTQLVQESISGNRKRLQWVIEPAGRSLHFLYTGTNSPRIASVTASDGRVVNYYYIYCNGCTLDHVVYYNNTIWTARYQYVGANVGGGDMPLLLRTCDDPMYAGPMKRIAYDYKPATPNNPDNTTPVYGQILRERYWDGVAGHEGSGAVVSTLTVGLPNNNPVYRTETRGDGSTRAFIYNGAGPGYLAWASDFTNRYASQTYDSYKYINSVTDRNGNRTDYTNYALTGNVNVVTYPLTPGDTPGQQTRPTVRYQYGWANCPDVNNRDANNPYYLYSVTDEGGHATIFTRDANKRVTRIDYPDGGYEQFTYNGFGQVLTHPLKTGGTETFAYDGLYRLQYYSDPYHSNPGNPSIQYFYEGHGWVNGIFDALAHPTNWTYNDRGEVLVTTLPTDPVDNTRHTITNVYNPDGTLQSRTNELGYVTNYAYDDYRRLKSVTPPGRGDNTGLHITSFYYGANASDNVNDYKLTDSNVTWLVLPSGKQTKTVYDDNRLKSTVTVGYGTSDAATTSYTYDAVGNLTTITFPLNHNNTTIDYDQRNRQSAIHVLSQVTTFQYDTAGRRTKITRPNGQTITNNTFDNMNRVTQQTVTQNLDPDAITKFTYYGVGEGQPVGALKYFKDPRISGTNDNYKYEYDTMGRKKKLTYPGGSLTEQWTYDTAGRLQTFINRNSKTQTFSYDALSRMTGFSWNDGLTPSVSFAYDAASRVTSINNANATIQRLYRNDNLLGAETETITGGTSKGEVYFYDGDGNRNLIYYPDNDLTFTYTYTGRNQLKAIAPWVTYEYDARGNLTTRTLYNGTHTDYPYYDEYDRAGWVVHYLNDATPEFNYGYDDLSNNRKWVRRLEPGLGDIGDTFGYDRADQVSGVALNVATPQSSPPPSRTIFYDANGNRTTFRPYGPTDTYVTNNLNQYTSRNSNNAAYDLNGNLIASPDPAASQLTCTYDAQNRLLSAGKAGGQIMYFKYDGLNRQVSRTVNGTTTYNVWDGWDLIEEYPAGGAPTAYYLYGADGLILDTQAENTDINWYYHDGSGSTSHIADSYGNLKEWYRYDLQGTPFIYAPNNTTRTASALKVSHLFTGQQWYKDIGLYDLRNRFYSPDIGRLLQPDPIGFQGGNNLYRYCGNNPVTRLDPFGLQYPTSEEGHDIPTYEHQYVDAPPLPGGFPVNELPPGLTISPGTFTVGPDGRITGFKGGGFGYRKGNGQKQSSAPPPSAPPPQNPPPPSAPAAGVFSDWQQLAPLGSAANPIHFSDSFLSRVLADERATVSSANLQSRGYLSWANYMLQLNVPEFYNTSYYSYDGYLSEMNGVFSGHEINYLGEGMGFAASGMSEAQMTAYIFSWKNSQYLWYGATLQWNRLPGSGIRGSEFMWAELGYTYYINGGHL